MGRHSNPKERGQLGLDVQRAHPLTFRTGLCCVILPPLKLFLHLNPQEEEGVTPEQMPVEHFAIIRSGRYTQNVNIKCGKRNIYTNLWFLIKAQIAGFLNENFGCTCEICNCLWHL